MATQSKFFADLGIKSATNTEIDGNLSVSGNLTVSGTQTTIDSTTKSVADSMIELASGNTTADLTDIGIYGNYNDGLSGESGVSEYTGLFRDATDSTWKLYDGLEVEPTTTVNTSGSGYTLADLQVGDLTATTLTATNTLTGGSMTYPTSDGTDGQVLKTNGSGTLSFGDAASTDGITASGSNTIVQSPDDTNVIHVNNNANVGISNSDPSAKVHIGTSNSVGSQTDPAIQIGGAGNYRLGIYTTAEGSVFDNKNGDDGHIFNVKTAGEAMRIDGGTGYVGIGIDSPAHSLVVAKTGINQASTVRIQGTDGNGNGHPLDLKMDGATDSFSVLIGQGGGATPDTILFSGNRNGNVAIGSSTANKLFNLADPAQGGEALKLHFEAASGSDKWGIYAYDRTNSHYANMSLGQNAIWINGSDSNVGIGTTTPSNNHANANNLVVGDGTAGGIANYVGANLGWYAFSRDNANNTDAYDGGISYDGSRNLMFHTNAGTERLTINGDGNMHLGQSDADVQLFLGSTGGGFGGNSTNNVRASGSSLMLNTPGQFIVEKSGSLGILMDTDKSFYVRPATSSDNFGMYVRTSNSADTGMKIGRTGTNNAEMGIKVSSQGSSSFASFKFAISDATTWSSDDWFKLKVSGEMDGNFNDTSDQNLKENIVSIPNGDLAKVMQLNPVTFDWKNAVSRNDQTGFVAQEVETIFPNEVLGDAYDVEVEGSGKSINTIGLLSHTVKALQELKTLVDALETRIATLES